MKFVAVAMLSIVHMSPVLAEESYPHEYENGGYFPVQNMAPAAEARQAEEPFRHEYENGGHFAGVIQEARRPEEVALRQQNKN